MYIPEEKLILKKEYVAPKRVYHNHSFCEYEFLTYHNFTGSMF